MILVHPSKPSEPGCLRSATRKRDFDRCMFCQNVKTEWFINVQTINTTEEKKLELSTYKLTLSNVLANAVEGKCHLTCYAKFLREYTDVKETVEQSDLALEIKNSASKGNVLFFFFFFFFYLEV